MIVILYFFVVGKFFIIILVNLYNLYFLSEWFRDFYIFIMVDDSVEEKSGYGV